MQNEPERASKTAAAQRSRWREMIEVVVGIALIAAIFLLAIVVGLAR